MLDIMEFVGSGGCLWRGFSGVGWGLFAGGGSWVSPLLFQRESRDGDDFPLSSTSKAIRHSLVNPIVQVKLEGVFSKVDPIARRF